MSIDFGSEKKKWSDRVSSVVGRIETLEKRDSDGELFKKWGIPGYQIVDKNQNDIERMKGDLEGLEKTIKVFRKDVSDGKFFADEKDKEEFAVLFNNLERRLFLLQEKVRNKLGILTEAELAKLRTEIQNTPNIEETRKEIEEKIKKEREASYNQKFNTGLISLLATKIPLDPLNAKEAEILARRQKVYDEMRVQKELADKNILNIKNQTATGMLSVIKQGLLVGQQAGSAVATGASELTSELYWLGVNRTLMFLAWPIALPIKAVNVGLTGLKWFFTGASVLVDETLNKRLMQPIWNWYTDYPSKTGNNIVGGILRGFASLVVLPGGIIGGGLVLVTKGLAGFFEGAKKYFNWDWLVRNKPDFSTLAGGLGGPVVLITTLALLIAAPFTFGATGLLLAGLWAGFGLSAVVGLGLAVKNAKDATKAELSLELPAEQSIQLMDYEHRTNKRLEAEQRKAAKPIDLVGPADATAQNALTQNKSTPALSARISSVEERSIKVSEHAHRELPKPKDFTVAPIVTIAPKNPAPASLTTEGPEHLRRRTVVWKNTDKKSNKDNTDQKVDNEKDRRITQASSIPDNTSLGEDPSTKKRK